MATFPTLLAHPEVGPDVGHGHVARVYALVEAWVRRGGTAVVWCQGVPVPWTDRFESVGVDVVPRCPESNFDWAVLDGYTISDHDRDAASDRGRHVLVIDDHQLTGATHVDLVIDQNAGAVTGGYDAEQVLAGPRYALIRAEFVEARRDERVAMPVARVAMLGGGAPSGVVRALLDAARIDIVASGLDIVTIDNQRKVAASLASASVALTPAGSAALELCCLGIPQVVFSVADNQRIGGRALDESGVAVDLGPIAGLTAKRAVAAVLDLARDHDRRSTMSARAKELVDGRGADRVIVAMRSALVHLRPATIDDARRLFDWRNEAETRRWSLSGAGVEWGDHIAWFQQRLTDQDTFLFIVEEQSRPLGQLRFDASSDGEAEVSIGLAPAARGHGLAAPVIDAGTRRLFATTSVRRVVARVKRGNDASIASFVNADFDLDASRSTDNLLLYSRTHDDRRI